MWMRLRQATPKQSTSDHPVQFLSAGCMKTGLVDRFSEQDRKAHGPELGRRKRESDRSPQNSRREAIPCVLYVPGALKWRSSTVFGTCQKGVSSDMRRCEIDPAEHLDNSRRGAISCMRLEIRVPVCPNRRSRMRARPTAGAPIAGEGSGRAQRQVFPNRRGKVRVRPTAGVPQL